MSLTSESDTSSPGVCMTFGADKMEAVGVVGGVDIDGEGLLARDS